MTCPGCVEGCTTVLPEAFAPLLEEPISTEVKMADGVFTKSMVIRHAGTFVGQHSHVYPHVSVLVKGAMHVWRDGVYDAEYQGPIGITIPAGVLHTFKTTRDNTIILCVHDIGEAEAVEIAERHHFEGVT